MTIEQTGPLDREDRLAAALVSCLEALDSGPPVDRETLLTRYPEFASELARFLDDQEQVECRAAPLRAVAALHPAAEMAEHFSVPKELGDFRILREVGRGGMGIVYEAKQISLRRRVALKVLPFAATMDPRHLQRFQNEAQAAACLHHTNIVPVFFVGCERGVHFYAMQFIDGQPLSDLIRQLSGREKTASMSVGEARTEVYQPASGDAPATMPLAAEMTPLTGEGKRGRDYYRKVAELGVQAAEALDHAHQLGIVHRDIKPANLLLDGRGNLWVTDFGLAHMQQSEANLTVTGQALGTPRYMSPEQALAKRVPIDHRTDVYSLGATLYELLTLCPAFGSEDRQELLRQIAFDDPAKLRRRERAIPAELEIIVLKAMEKRPQDRYATAQELADDLERWLKHEPIRAKRPGMVQRAAKWGRRHRPLVVAAVLSLFLALIMLTGSNLVIWHEHEETKEALRLARLRQNEFDLQAIKLGKIRDESELKLQRSLKAMDGILTSLDQTLSEEGVASERSRQAVSDRALKFYCDVLSLEMSDRPEEVGLREVGKTLNYSLLWEMMWAYIRMGNLRAHRNQFNEAQQAYNKAYAIAPHVVSDILTPDEITHPFEEAVERHRVVIDGVIASQIREHAAVEKAYRRALAHWRKTSPEGLGAVQDYRAAMPGVWQDVSKEIIRWERIVEDLPTLNNVHRLVFFCRQYGDELRKADRVEDAKAAYRRALEYAEKRVNDPVSKKDPEWAVRAQTLATEIIRLGGKLVSVDLPVEGESAVRIGLVLYEQLMRANPQLVNRSGDDIAPAWRTLGNLLSDSGRLAEAEIVYRQGLAIFQKFSDTFPDLPYSLNWVILYHDLGRVLQQRGCRAEAEQTYRQGLALFIRRQESLKASPYTGNTVSKRGDMLFFEPGHESHPEIEELFHNDVRLVELDGKLPAILSGQQQATDTVERLALAQLCQMPCKKRYTSAFRFYREAFAAEPKLADDLSAPHRYNAACAAALAGCGQGKDGDKLDDKERARLRQQALDWLRADLKAYRLVMDKSAGKAGPAIAQKMQHWLQDTDFAGVRGEDDLRKLPEAERPAWQKLWQEVEALRQQAATKTKPPSAVDQPNRKEESPRKD